MLDLADQPLNDRLVQNLMSEPENDGGQWGAPFRSSPPAETLPGTHRNAPH